MMLEEYITDLLYRYDCVIVPNFGGFVANTNSAQINNGTFSPPYKKITFNSLLQNNDGLLANYIAQVDKMPYGTAVNFIAFETQGWINKLLTEPLDLKGIGSLYLDNEKIQFEPENTVNYLTTSFGLSKFTSQAIQKELVAVNSDTMVLENKRKIYKEQVSSIEEKTPIFITSEKRKTPNLLKYAAVFLIGATILGFSGKLYQQKVEQNQIATINKNNKIKVSKIQTATFIIDTPLPTITLNAKQLPNKYHIIAGAFSSEKNAQKKVRQLKNKGFDNAKIVGKNRFNLTQVEFSGYYTINDAKLALAQIKSAEDKSAWLLIK